MSEEAKLEGAQKHVLKLISRDGQTDEWTRGSGQLFSALSADIPPRLAVFEKLEVGGRARLTDKGDLVVDAMTWL